MVAKNGKGHKMVGFVKTFDHYQRKFNFGHFFSSPVKLKRIWKLDQNLIMALIVMAIYTLLL